MKSRKLIFGVLLTLCFTFLQGCSLTGQKKEKEQLPKDYEGLMTYWSGQTEEEELTCWYTSEADKTLLEEAAQAFSEKYQVKVTLVFYDGVNLFEDMNQANQEGTGPELYIMGNDQLELAVTSGMAQENTFFTDSFWKENYPQPAKSAVTYHDRQYGYPIYFDTYCLVYDANLLESAPASIEDILIFLDEYEDTGSTKAVFRWDVADPYINTMFIASYAELFGENGDDSHAFTVNNEKCIEAMQYYQSLSEYLWMDKTNISHDTVRNRIEDGTLVLGLCKSDILPTLYQMENAGEEATTNYQISYVPSLTSELSSNSFSTTYSALVNPYGKDEALANLFACYLSYENAPNQFAGNGKLPVRNQGEAFDKFQTVLYAQYLNAKPVPKVMVLGDYLTESGIVFDAIWDGEDVTDQLTKLQTVMEQKLK